MARVRLFDTSRMPRRKLASLRTGYDCVHAPSMAARRFWYYVLNMGEAHWPGGYEFGRPRPGADNQGYLLHYVLEGELVHDVGKRRCVARVGDAVLLDISRSEIHRNETRKPARFLWLLFDGWGLQPIFNALEAERNPVIPGIPKGVMLRLFRGLLDVIAAEPPWYEARMSALLGDLLAELFVARPPRPLTPGMVVDPQGVSGPVREALEYIARNHARPLSLKGLCQAVNLSLFHFSHRFRQETGFSPMAYVNLYRMEQARTLLSNTDKPVGRVAEAVGIPNVRYFARLFRRMSGATPRAYRTRHRPMRVPARR